MPKKAKRRIHQCACKSCQLHPHRKIAKQHKAINRVLLELNERNRRRFVGVLANERGRGEIERANKKQSVKIRHSGAGRLPVEKNNHES